MPPGSPPPPDPTWDTTTPGQPGRGSGRQPTIGACRLSTQADVLPSGVVRSSAPSKRPLTARRVTGARFGVRCVGEPARTGRGKEPQPDGGTSWLDLGGSQRSPGRAVTQPGYPGDRSPTAGAVRFPRSRSHSPPRRRGVAGRSLGEPRHPRWSASPSPLLVILSAGHLRPPTAVLVRPDPTTGSALSGHLGVVASAGAPEGAQGEGTAHAWAIQIVRGVRAVFQVRHGVGSGATPGPLRRPARPRSSAGPGPCPPFRLPGLGGRVRGRRTLAGVCLLRGAGCSHLGPPSDRGSGQRPANNLYPMRPNVQIRSERRAARGSYQMGS